MNRTYDSFERKWRVTIIPDAFSAKRLMAVCGSVTEALVFYESGEPYSSVKYRIGDGENHDSSRRSNAIAGDDTTVLTSILDAEWDMLIQEVMDGASIGATLHLRRRPLFSGSEVDDVVSLAGLDAAMREAHCPSIAPLL